MSLPYELIPLEPTSLQAKDGTGYRLDRCLLDIKADGQTGKPHVVYCITYVPEIENEQILNILKTFAEECTADSYRSHAETEEYAIKAQGSLSSFQYFCFWVDNGVVVQHDTAEDKNKIVPLTQFFARNSPEIYATICKRLEGEGSPVPNQ